jgi:surfactin synthase thioesterase subunit
MGAYLALRVANLLDDSNRLPVCVIVSGNPGPGVGAEKKRHLLAPGDFIEEIRRIGGVPEELLENKELFDFFEPVLRADFEIAETVGLTGERPIKAPLFAMMGDKEEKVDQIANWTNYARNGFRYEILEGDHFFIHKHPERIAMIIRECYGKCVLNLFR